MQTDSPRTLTLLLSAREAVEALAISPRKLWGMTNSGEIPFVRIGRSVRYYEKSLREWILDQQKNQSKRS